MKKHGLHIVGDLYRCNTSTVYWQSITKLRLQISRLIKQHGFHALGSFYHRFGPRAYTGLVSLVESHVSFHTWPEYHYVSLDVFVCNIDQDNSQETKKLFRGLSGLFRPRRSNVRFLRR